MLKAFLTAGKQEVQKLRESTAFDNESEQILQHAEPSIRQLRPTQFTDDGHYERLKDALEPECEQLVNFLKPGIIPQGDQGFFLVSLVNVLRKSARCYPAILDFTAAAFQKAHKLDHVMVVPKPLKPGIRRGQKIFGDTGPVRLDQISRIVEEMERAAITFPPFFVFYYDSKGAVEETEHGNLRQDFGRILHEVYEQQIRRNPNETT